MYNRISHPKIQICFQYHVMMSSFLRKMDGYNLSDVIEKVESMYTWIQKNRFVTENKFQVYLFKIFSFADFSHVLKNNKN